MKKLLLTVAAASAMGLLTLANDSSYSGTGAVLSPRHETDIDIVKENLTIQLTDSGFSYFTVEYTLVNSGKAKSVTMGFETDTYCSAEGISPNGNPNMQNFVTRLNGKTIPYTVKLVLSEYLQEEYEESHDYSVIDDCDGGVTYAYSFDATFPHGESKLVQTFKLMNSNNVDNPYYIPYKLTPATRWGNGKIEDFTLTLDARGYYRHFWVDGDDALVLADWQGDPTLKNLKWKTMAETFVPKKDGYFDENEEIKPHKSRYIALHDSWIQAKIKDYAPTEELSITSPRLFYSYEPERQLVFGDGFQGETFIPEINGTHNTETGEFEYENWDFYSRVKKVLPYALRGYIPTDDPEVLAHLKKISWYMPDPSYTPRLEDLNETEQEFVKSRI